MSKEETAKIKIKRVTAIGTGRYKVRSAMSPKRDRIVLWLDGVVGFQAIQMHSGAIPEHSDGCPLVGLRRVHAGRIGGGPDAEAWLVARVQECEARGEEVYCVISRAPGYVLAVSPPLE